MLRRWQRRLRYWLHREERARLLREEMELHLEMAGCLLAAGLATKYLAWFLLAPLAVRIANVVLDDPNTI